MYPKLDISLLINVIVLSDHPLFYKTPYVLIHPNSISSQVQILGIRAHKCIPIIHIP